MRRKKEPEFTREEKFLGIRHPQEPEPTVEPTENKFLSAQEVAAFLGIHSNTFTQWRVVGKGPVFVKRGGRVFYDTEVLQRWKNENVSIGEWAQKRLLTSWEFTATHFQNGVRPEKVRLMSKSKARFCMTLRCWKNTGKRKLVDVLNGFEQGGKETRLFFGDGGRTDGSLRIVFLFLSWLFASANDVFERPYMARENNKKESNYETACMFKLWCGDCFRHNI